MWGEWEGHWRLRVGEYRIVYVIDDRRRRVIIRLMVEMTAPGPKDVICDPACGTCGFLVASGKYLRQHHLEILRDAKLRAPFHERAFHGFDFDNTCCVSAA